MDSKIINFKSMPKETPFAPEWNYYLIEDLITDIDFKLFSKFLLSKEKTILKFSPAVSDGYTGLGMDSTTARFHKLNILNFKNKAIPKIKKAILKTHNKLLRHLKLKLPKHIFVQCWVNIMRKGEKIKPHIHQMNPQTYLGGHICIQTTKTSTSYINPVNQINDPELYTSHNEVGKITLFPNCIPHFTNRHEGDDPRITLAFDLFVVGNVTKTKHMVKLNNETKNN